MKAYNKNKQTGVWFHESNNKSTGQQLDIKPSANTDFNLLTKMNPDQRRPHINLMSRSMRIEFAIFESTQREIRNRQKYAQAKMEQESEFFSALGELQAGCRLSKMDASGSTDFKLLTMMTPDQRRPHVALMPHKRRVEFQIFESSRASVTFDKSLAATMDAFNKYNACVIICCESTTLLLCNVISILLISPLQATLSSTCPSHCPV